MAAATKSSKWQQTAEALKSGEELSDRRQYGRALDIDSNGGGEESNELNNALNEETNELPMPGCHMKIYSGDVVAENVKIGDPLKLMISIDKQAVYGSHVTDCLVRDGLGWGEQKLINVQGYLLMIFI